MSANTIAESAAVRQAATGHAPDRECLSFRLGDEEYGIDILRVQEIRGYEPPTRLVGAPPFVLGVLDLRGTIMPVIDLRARFGLPQGITAQTVTIVLNVGGRTIGAVVDGVSDVVDLTPEQLRPAPAFNGSFDARYISGLGCIRQAERERMLILLDIEQLLGGLGALIDSGIAAA